MSSCVIPYVVKPQPHQLVEVIYSIHYAVIPRVHGIYQVPPLTRQIRRIPADGQVRRIPVDDVPVAVDAGSRTGEQQVIVPVTIGKQYIGEVEPFSRNAPRVGETGRAYVDLAVLRNVEERRRIGDGFKDVERRTAVDVQKAMPIHVEKA